MRRLFLLRHAKSAWPEGIEDFDRPLAPRGLEAAGLLGRYFSRQQFQPELVLVSAARRTRETFGGLQGQWSPAGLMREDGRLYAARTDTLLEIVRETPPDCESLMLVGHNPGIAELALLLADGRGGDDRKRLTQKYPSGGLAVLEFSQADWRLTPHSGRLDRFVTPRLLGGTGED